MTTQRHRPRLLPLVLCAGAAQAQLVVLAPTVSSVADEFRISVGLAGQAGSIAAVAAIVTALGMLAWSGLREARSAGAGAAACVVGSAGVALAPGVGAFLAWHVLVGAGLAMLVSLAS